VARSKYGLGFKS